MSKYIYKFIIFITLFWLQNVFAADDPENPTPPPTLCQIQTEIPEVECNTLVAIYENSGGANWSDSASNNWNQTNAPCSSWEGVYCSNGHVISILRGGVNLIGSLPDLSALTSLKYLVLSENYLSGNIPDFSNLTALEYLDLANNQFTQIPNLTALTSSLKTLDLSGFQITQFPDLSAFQLEYLTLNNNQLTEIPSYLSNMTTLERLSLSNNQLTGDIPDLSALTSLKNLNLSRNKLNANIPDLTNLTALLNLDLSSNELTGNIPDLTNLANLYILRLENNQLSGNIPDLSSLINLQYLDLSNNQLLTGNFPDLSNNSALLFVDLSYNQLTGNIPDLSNLTNLLLLRFSNNKLAGEIPVSFTNLTQLGNVTGDVTIGSSPNQWLYASVLFENYLDLDSDKFTASDPTVIDFFKNHGITIKPIEPPELEPIPDQTKKVGETLLLSLIVTNNKDGDTLSFSLVDAPAGATIENNLLIWKTDKVGTFNFTVKVTDNAKPTLSDEKSFAVTVEEAEIMLQAIPDQTIEFGETLEVRLIATDKDGNILNDINDFSIVEAPNGASIKDGILTWKADKADVFNFTVKVTNNNNSYEQTFEVTVKHQLTLTTAIFPKNAGSITIDSIKENYEFEDKVNLTAIAAECYEFSHWEGACKDQEIKCSLSMDANKETTAHFKPKSVNLSVTAKNGSVKIEPEQTEYFCDDNVKLTALPEQNYNFLSWDGYISSVKNPIEITLKEQDINIKAIFATLSDLIVTPNKVITKLGQTLQFKVSGGNGNYFWDATGGELSANGNTATYKVTEEGSFYIWASDGYGLAWSLVDTEPTTLILLRIDPNALNLSVGDQQAISVLAYKMDGSSTNIIEEAVLESENSDIVQVMQNGQVIARGVGETKLIASYQNLQTEISVSVKSQNQLLKVEPDIIILSEGEQRTINIYSVNQNGNTTVFQNAELSINDTNIASVNNTTITGVQKGSTWLSVKTGENILQVPVVVRFAPPLSVTPNPATIEQNKTVRLTISGGKPPYQITSTMGKVEALSTNDYIFTSTESGNASLTITDTLSNNIKAEIQVVAPLDISPKQVNLTGSEDVILNAINGDGSYVWSATSGVLSDQIGNQVTYTAPNSAGIYTVTVTDGLGNTRDILIKVGSELLLSQQQIFLQPEQSVELNVLGGEFPYKLNVSGGEAIIVDNNIIYTAPKVAGNYSLTVTDNTNHQISAEIKVALDLIITPSSARIDAGESLTLHAAGGFGEKRWFTNKGYLDKTEGETVTWTAPDNFGPAIIYVMDDAGTTAVANLEVASSGFAVTPSVRHVYPNDNANFTAVGGAAPYTWIVEQGDYNAVDDETINYQADNIRGSYKIEITDSSGKKAQAQVNVYSTKLFASPKILYINKTETLPITIGGGTGNYTITSQLGKVADNQLKLEQDQRSITTNYTALKTFEGQDIIHILDTAGNLASIKVEIAKKDDIIDLYRNSDGKIDEAGMAKAIDDFFAGQAWLDRTIMFEIAELFISE